VIDMPKPIIYAVLVLLIFAMIPPALIARSRAVPSDKRRIHLIQDMDNQTKFRAQHPNAIFADERAMRPLVPGTVARGELDLDHHFTRGVTYGGDGKPQWATTFPSNVRVDMNLLRHGRERFNIYCMPCHGESGYGDGIIHQRADQLVRTGTNGTEWVQPKSLHEQLIREQPVGQIFNSITNGIRTMPAYDAQIPTADRWAIVAYVEALQRSQFANENDVPAAERTQLPVIRISAEQEEPQS
jgi:mono/diheme cytochrome c family protein